MDPDQQCSPFGRDSRSELRFSAHAMQCEARSIAVGMHFPEILPRGLEVNMGTMLKQLRNGRTEKAVEEKDLEYSSVQKALSIVLSFIPDNKAVGNQELSNALGLNKSTVSRLTRVLAHYGLLQQDEKTQKYELGRMSALLGMAVEASQSERLAQIGQPFVDSLRDTVGESVCLEIMGATGDTWVVCSAVGPPPLSVTFPESISMHVSAGAKAILAFSDHEFVEGMIKGSLSKSADGSIADPEVFRSRIEEARKQGVAYDHGEANPGVHTVSVAVFNHLKKPVAALSICVPAHRAAKTTDSKNLKLLKKTATMVSGRLFYEAPKE
jgi:DNA-binding IclR family transcriptional regulator